MGGNKCAGTATVDGAVSKGTSGRTRFGVDDKFEFTKEGPIGHDTDHI